MADGMHDDPSLNSSGRPRVVISTRHAAAASSGGGSAFASSAPSSSSAPRSVSVRTKGRGFKSGFGDGASAEDRYAGKGGEFESIDEREEAGGAVAQKCQWERQPQQCQGDVQRLVIALPRVHA